jgi:hypothetical protein
LKNPKYPSYPIAIKHKITLEDGRETDIDCDANQMMTCDPEIEEVS